MTNSTKRYVLSNFHTIEESIEKYICYIQDYASNAFRIHSANAENISAYSTRLAELRGKRDGIIFTLQSLGYELIWDGEHLSDISDRRETES